MVLEVTNEEFNKLIIKNKVVIIDFWAPWCGPCKTLGPIIDKVANDNVDDNVVIRKVNVDDESELAQLYNIRSVPTMIFLKNGEVVERLVGIHSESDIKKTINKIK